nr:sulfotransferase domain-containing protein [Desulfobulbaceae bacterium]
MKFTGKQRQIKSWQKFGREVRRKGCCLLDRLGDYSEPVLVTGCQRSGTTLLARILRHSNGFVDFQTGKDDELDAALILCGREKSLSKGRYCFQTTYVNECYHEYFAHKNNVKMIWVLRDPYSVVWSMLYNWERFALNELYLACGEKFHKPKRKSFLAKYFLPDEDKLTKACLSYRGKTEQLFELHEIFSASNLMVIDYNDLILNSQKLLPGIYDFVNEPYHESYADKIHAKSIDKCKSISSATRQIIERDCADVYMAAQKLIQPYQEALFL